MIVIIECLIAPEFDTHIPLRPSKFNREQTNAYAGWFSFGNAKKTGLQTAGRFLVVQNRLLEQHGSRQAFLLQDFAKAT
ncbi:hypothetical protein MARINON1_60452 [Marinobacter salarius]|nr:hypothetical protein MBHK15_100039 [Marinobacter salarius]VXC52126.1 hypothetical protein MARINON1_60452 [Marinobacter salarius]